MNMNQFTVLLPMKGHSERVPNKNLKKIAGKPLCFWILETLTKLNPKKIIINTDSDEIANMVSAKFKVTIHKRPAEIQGDMVPMNKVIENDLQQDAQSEYFLQTHSTNPLIKPETIAHAATQFIDSIQKNDSLFSVTPHYARFYDQSGKPINHDLTQLVRTQDLKPLLEENSNLYFFTRTSFLKNKKRIGEKPILFQMNPIEAFDIDEQWQWDLVEKLLVK